MTRVKSWVVVCAPGVRLSVICTVKVEVPEVVGVPEVAPEDDKVRPSGKEPAPIDQVEGFCPPVAARAEVYGWPMSPLGSELVVIVRGQPR